MDVYMNLNVTLEFACYTRICMLHSIWCIYVYFHIWKSFRAYYYRILR